MTNTKNLDALRAFYFLTIAAAVTFFGNSILLGSAFKSLVSMGMYATYGAFFAIDFAVSILAAIAVWYGIRSSYLMSEGLQSGFGAGGKLAFVGVFVVVVTMSMWI